MGYSQIVSGAAGLGYLHRRWIPSAENHNVGRPDGIARRSRTLNSTTLSIRLWTPREMISTSCGSHSSRFATPQLFGSFWHSLDLIGRAGGRQAAMEVRGLVFALITLWTCHTTALPFNKRALSVVHKINEEGPWIGLVTVYPPEEEAFISAKALKPHPKYPRLDFSGRRFRMGTIYGRRVVYVRCGVGMLNAGVTIQTLADLFNIAGIVHFGIAGNANSSLSVGDVTIPRYVAHTGIWEWLKSNGTMEPNNVGHLQIGDYNVPRGMKSNLLGKIAYQPEEFYKETGKPNVPQDLFWAEISLDWLERATKLKGLKLVSCLNSTVCLSRPATVVVGLRASTSNIFVDNPAYREFLFKHFQVASVDEESAAVVLTCLSNKLPVIVFRGLSDLAGAQQGVNAIGVFGPLAAKNAVKVTLEFIKTFPSSTFTKPT